MSGSQVFVHTSAVSSIPSGVTCTTPEIDFAPFENSPITYVYNDCTNWNFSKRHVTIITYRERN